jgi:hypothetical protein
MKDGIRTIDGAHALTRLHRVLISLWWWSIVVVVLVE